MAGTLVTTNILQTVVAMGMQALRENLVLAQTANRRYEQEIRGLKKGQVVNISVPAAIATRSVTSNVVPPAVTAVTPTSVSITVDQWQEAAFAMEDKALAQVSEEIVPDEITEAIKALSNTIDNHLWSKINAAAGIYGLAGVAGTTPFGTDLSEFLDAQKIYYDQLAPADPDNVFVAVSTAANANLLGLTQVTSNSFRNDGGRALLRGELGELLGARFLMTQNIPTHSQTAAGTINVNDGGTEVGDPTLTWNGGGTTPAVGDIFTVAGDTQTYQVQSSTSTIITMLPTAQVAWDNAASVTFKGDYAMNLLYHRDLIGFAMAPLQETQMLQSDNVAVAIDEQSGLALRLEVTRQYKQYQWAFDALYGAAIIRPQHGVIIAG